MDNNNTNPGSTRDQRGGTGEDGWPVSKSAAVIDPDIGRSRISWRGCGLFQSQLSCRQRLNNASLLRNILGCIRPGTYRPDPAAVPLCSAVVRGVRAAQSFHLGAALRRRTNRN